MLKVVLFVLLILQTTTVLAEVEVVSAFPNLTFSQIVDLQTAKDGSNRLFVVQKTGEIYSFSNDPLTNSKSLYLSISDRVATSSEQGLLGLAFHPKFLKNGYFYVNYTRKSDGGTVIARFQEIGGMVNFDSELIILRFAQPFSNHNGGSLAFGPDGYLYIASGDGGSGGDPLRKAQDKKSLLGKILRIDIDRTKARRNYFIPPTNPFVGNTKGFRKEIFAYGLRNPWKMSFDFETRKLWVGDVGQANIEEINIIRNGGNYGWSLFEGEQEFNCIEPICSRRGTIKPVYFYDHSVGSSITGGYVYRGSLVPELYGKYIYADFANGNIFALGKEGKNIATSQIADTELAISSFGVDQNQELYILDYRTSKIYRFN